MIDRQEIYDEIVRRISYSKRGIQELRNNSRLYINSEIPSPDHTIILSLPAIIAYTRLKSRGRKFDGKYSIGVLDETQNKYLQLPQFFPECTIVNSNRNLNNILNEIGEIIT